MAAVIALGVLAVCLQGKFKVEGTPGYYEPLSLYTVLIAAPGERKSGVMRAMTGVLYDYEREYNAKHADAVRRNRQERESIERQINGLRKRRLETRWVSKSAKGRLPTVEFCEFERGTLGNQRRPDDGIGASAVGGAA